MWFAIWWKVRIKSILRFWFITELILSGVEEGKYREVDCIMSTYASAFISGK